MLRRRIDFHSGKKAIATTSERLNAMNNTNVGFVVSESVLQQGKVFSAVVTRVHNGGVSVKVLPAGISGIVKLSSFGETKELREATLAKVKIGHKLTVKVESYQPCMQQYVLTKVETPRKPMKHLLPAGTTIVVDSANVLGRVHEVAMEVSPIEALRSLEEGLVSLGYKPIFFMEYGTYGWAMKTYAAHAEAFDAFCKAKVGLVCGEADEVLLQTAFSMPDAVILTNDRLRDYAEAYPEIVGTKRVCGYTVVGGAYPVMAIQGVKELIPLQTLAEETGEATEEELPPEIACIEERLESPVTPRACCQKVALHELRRKASQHDATAFEALATYYAEGTCVKRNFRKSAVLDRAAQEAKKREQQLRRRAQRGNYRCYKYCA